MTDTTMQSDPIQVSATPPAPQVEKPWFDGADPETIGHLQAHGWDKRTAPEAALEAVKSYREAQKLLGAPPSQLLRFPKDAGDTDGWKSVWSRLGAPADAAGYDLAGVKFADGSALDDGFSDGFKSAAAGLHLTKEQASGVAQFFAGFMDKVSTAEGVERQAALANEQTSLRQNWGANYEANLFVAKQAAAALGVKPEQVATLETSIGYAGVMEMFRSLGMKIGEGRYIAGDKQGSNPGVMTREEASAKMDALKHDAAWVKRYLSGDREAAQEMQALVKMLSA